MGSWRFAETPRSGRADAVSTGNVARAWEASSAAAGALMLLVAGPRQHPGAAGVTPSEVITPRSTRLVRVPDLQAFRRAMVGLAIDGAPLDARDRIVVVPTRAAAAQLVRSIEATLDDPRRAVVLPDFVTTDELVFRLAERLDPRPTVLHDAEREALAMVACRAARDAGHAPPFRLRPGLVAEVLRFYDALGRYQKDVDTFERLALGLLEPGAADDRGAERLVRQTRFLSAAFRELESRQAAAGADEHVLRARLVQMAAPRPWRHVVVAVGDRSSDPDGLWPADWDVLARLPGLERLDVVVTDATLAGDLHERLHHLLPGIDEVRADPDAPPAEPLLQVPPDGAVVHVARDREEEVAGFARRVKAAVRTGALARLDRAALVVRSPLPYVYVTREVLRSAGVPCQMFDALPLAAEPWAAAFDLVCSAVGTGFARGPAIALLGSPHFRFASDDGEPLAAGDVSALDRALAEHGYLGQLPALQALVAQWSAKPGSKGRHVRQVRAGQVLVRLATRARAAARARPGLRIIWTSCSRSSPPSRRRRAPTIRRARGSCGRAAPSSARWPAFATPTAVSIRRPWSSTTPPPCAGAGSKPRPLRRVGRSRRAPGRQRQRPLRRLRRRAAGGPRRG